MLAGPPDFKSSAQGRWLGGKASESLAADFDGLEPHRSGTEIRAGVSLTNARMPGAGNVAANHTMTDRSVSTNCAANDNAIAQTGTEAERGGPVSTRSRRGIVGRA